MGAIHKLSNLIRVVIKEWGNMKRRKFGGSSMLFPLFLVLISTVICVANYKPDTFLSGWDTLHPEFNFRVYWNRIFFGVWQEHQGLGALASQAHASEIPRVFILQLLSLFLPIASLRYIYFFICLLLGPLGVYFFISKIVLSNKMSDDGKKEPFAFLGALVYLLNLSTLQQFYVPLEMFATHFASLGWLCFLASKYILQKKKKTLLYFFLVSLLSTSMAHTATLWYAFFFAFSGYLVLFAFHNLGFGLKAIKAFFSVIFVLIVSNAFWFFPNIYFAINHGADVQNSKIHRLFSQEAFLQNREFGDFKNIAILKNFLFNWGENVGNGRYGQLLDEWSYHLSRVGVLEIGYGVFALVLVGILVSVLSKKYRQALPVIFIFLASYFFMANANPPFDKIFVLLQQSVPLFKEALRFPFTKFSILLSFSYAVFLSVSISGIYTMIKQTRFSKLTWVFIPITTVLITASLIYYMFPIFRGNLISSSMRVAIPERYFEMFNFFSEQKDDFRIATFPINTMFGWQYYNWDKVNKLGYQGAGFLWFGIRQPIMDREFDRWFQTNEQYYREMSYAIYSKNPSLFSNLLDKYGIQYLILDESVMALGDDPNTKSLFIKEIKDLFNLSNKVSLVRDFNEGLYVYKVSGVERNSFVYTFPTYAIVRGSLSRGYIDGAYSLLGNYVSREDNQNGIYYPLRNIYSISEEVLDSVFLMSGNTYKIDIPDAFKFVTLPKGEENVKNITSDPVYVGNTALSSSNSVLLSTFDNNIFTTKIDLSRFSIEPENCFNLDRDQLFGGESTKNGVLLKGRNTISCLTYPLRELLEGFTFQGKQGYFILKIGFDYYSPTEESPMYCLLDSGKGVCLNNSNKFLSYKPKRVEDYVFLSFEDLDRYYLRFMLDALNSGGTTEIDYLDMSLSVLTTSSEEIPIDVETVLPVIDDHNDIVGTFFGSVNYNYDITKVKRNSGLCGFKVPTYQNRVVNEDNYGHGYISYATENGFLCDFFLYTNLPHAFGYIFEIRSKNVSGLPLRVCLKNDMTGRCDLYVSLPDNREFTSNYYLIPSGYYGDFGYSLEVVNLSFGNLLTENSLQSARLLPFPYDYISKTSYQYSKTEDIQQKSDLKILSVKKYATPFYKVKIEGRGVLVLGQSYDKGWLLFDLWDKKVIKEHTVVNGWANGWELECLKENGCEGTFYIFYWPQLLEFSGFTLLLLAIPLVFTKRFKRFPLKKETL
ncbi:MAG: hypothetical protein ABIB98_02470 [bacterium]